MLKRTEGVSQLPWASRFLFGFIIGLYGFVGWTFPSCTLNQLFAPRRSSYQEDSSAGLDIIFEMASHWFPFSVRKDDRSFHPVTSINKSFFVFLGWSRLYLPISMVMSSHFKWDFAYSWTVSVDLFKDYQATVHSDIGILTRFNLTWLKTVFTYGEVCILTDKGTQSNLRCTHRAQIKQV